MKQAIVKKDILYQPIHGDPKLSNFLFDSFTHKPIALIDLDTIQAGIIHYDIGDCLRSCCNPGGEEASNLKDVFFDINLFEAFLQGYFLIYGSHLTAKQIYYLPYSIKVITFELGIRFLTDFLRGNVYFKVENTSQNLYRSEVQFQLLLSIEQQMSSLFKIMQKVAKAA